MHVTIDDQIASLFFTGVIAVFTLIAIGGILIFLLRSISERFSFTRLALILAIPPFSLVNCLDRSGQSTLYLYAILVIVLGIVIDGANYLFPLKERMKAAAERRRKKSEKNSESGAIVWEKEDSAP